MGRTFTAIVAILLTLFPHLSFGELLSDGKTKRVTVISATPSVCTFLGRVAAIPFRPQQAGVDAAYDMLMAQPAETLRCIVPYIADTTPMQDPRGIPNRSNSFTVGDLAYMIFVRAGGVSFELCLPDSLHEALESRGTVAYFDWVSKRSNRLKLMECASKIDTTQAQDPKHKLNSGQMSSSTTPATIERTEGKTPDWSRHALILASPVSVQIRPKSEEGSVTQGAEYDVKLDRIEVLNGSFTANQVTLTLFAANRESLTKSREIFVLLRTDSREVTALYWGKPSKIACIPNELADANGIKRNFAYVDSQNDRRCTNAEWFR